MPCSKTSKVKECSNRGQENMINERGKEQQDSIPEKRGKKIGGSRRNVSKLSEEILLK